MDECELLVTGTRMDSGSIEATQIEITRPSSAKDKATRALIPYAVKKTKAMNILRRGVALSLATFSDGRFVQLAVVSPHLLDQVPHPVGDCLRMLANATGINEMRLL